MIGSYVIIRNRSTWYIGIKNGSILCRYKEWYDLMQIQQRVIRSHADIKQWLDLIHRYKAMNWSYVDINNELILYRYKQWIVLM